MMVDSNLSASFKWRSRFASGMVWMTLKNVKTSIISLDKFPSIDNDPEIAFSDVFLSASSYFCWILSRNNRNLSPYGHPFVDITVNAIFLKSLLKSLDLLSKISGPLAPDFPNSLRYLSIYFFSTIIVFENNYFCLNFFSKIFGKSFFSIFVFFVF